MHEMSVMVDIVDMMDQYADENQIPDIKVVVLQVGALTGIIPNYVYACWEAAIDHSKHLKNSSVKIEEIPGIGCCKDCRTEYDLSEHEGVCPSCSSRNWIELSGNEFVIKEILVE